ncbi:PREDICTED: uncharacterized protein LOC108374412 [Rhagoletis zephyria]|uniref:uncharacterized protein LOC108374412 n=1 Tax=Rhagoletis zephyria TaxID=28612 RepID=UPI0008112668|nr:PREDICTED: uncharacterized protein LOC108374412 [Rhagoletis zephyria]
MDINNMIFRLEDLTAEKVYEEYGINEEIRRENPGIYKMFVEDFIPTREDLEREIDEDGLKELCMRLPCRVLMYRWNPVQDFVDQFTRQGRIQRWTKEKTQKLLVKAVQRHKNVCLYSDMEIRKQREREWCERKKENLMRLEVWEYDRKQEEKSRQTEEQQCDANELSEDENHNAVPNEAFAQRSIISTVMDLEAVMAELHGTTVDSTPSDIVQMQPLSQTQANTLRNTQNTEELANREYVDLVRQLNSESGPNLADYINVNTESLGLEDSTAISQQVIDDGKFTPHNREYGDLVQQLNSEYVDTESLQLEDSTTISQQVIYDGECTPPYCEFTTLLSVTSTQSPTNMPVEAEVSSNSGGAHAFDLRGACHTYTGFLP